MVRQKNVGNCDQQPGRDDSSDRDLSEAKSECGRKGGSRELRVLAVEEAHDRAESCGPRKMQMCFVFIYIERQ